MGVRVGVSEKTFLERRYLSRHPKQCAMQVFRDKVFLARVLGLTTNITFSGLITMT